MIYFLDGFIINLLKSLFCKYIKILNRCYPDLINIFSGYLRSNLECSFFIVFAYKLKSLLLQISCSFMKSQVYFLFLGFINGMFYEIEKKIKESGIKHKVIIEKSWQTYIIQHYEYYFNDLDSFVLKGEKAILSNI